MSEVIRVPLEKRPRLSYPSPEPLSMSLGHRPSGIAGHDPGNDGAFRRQIISQLEQNFDQNKAIPGSHGERIDRLILEILRKSHSPLTSGAIKALIYDGDEAIAAVKKGRLHVPLFTKGQQHFRWSGGVRPIIQLFRRMKDSLSRTVSVQISSRKLTRASAELKTFQEVQDRFLEEGCTGGDSWNLLDVRSPLPSVLPSFLMGKNARLLHLAGDVILAGDTIKRARASRKKWNKWKNVLEWVLLSAGYNTGPHRDANGFATWITVQEGQIGIGWLSHPTDQELEEWMADLDHFDGGQWRYRVLNAGQSVLFPSGLVHYVFRRDDDQTFAVGRHVLL
jgi:hypothetical protein